MSLPQAEQAARRTAEALLAQERAQRRAEAAQLEASRQEVAAQKAALTALQAGPLHCVLIQGMDDVIRRQMHAVSATDGGT